MPAPSDLSDIAAEKARVRASVLAGRRSAPLAAREAADATLLIMLAELVREQQPGTVSAYVPLAGEPGGTGLPAALAAGVPLLLLPVLREDNDLNWAGYEGPGSLETTGRGLRQPSTPRLGPTAICSAELVIVPALAVDFSGVRLGRGGGSYDRALVRVPEFALVLALLYDGELVPRLPAEPHDRRVTAVITPSGGLVYLPTPAGRAGGR